MPANSVNFEPLDFQSGSRRSYFLTTISNRHAMSQDLNLLQSNIKALGAALDAVGAQSATIRYQGQDDSGDICDFEVETDQVERPHKVTYQQDAWTRVNGESVKAVQAVTAEFESAMSDVLWNAIELIGRDGFENNEGGSGALTVYASGFGVLHHKDNFEGESDHDRQTFTAAESQFGSSLASLAVALREAGFKAVHAEYTGSGDSGDGFHVGYTPENANASDPEQPGEVTYTVVSREYNRETQNIENVPREVTSDFETAFGDVAFLFIEHVMNHGGWENNEGGGGEVTLTADGTLKVEHYDNGETNSETNTFSWNEELATGEEREDAEAYEDDDEY